MNAKKAKFLRKQAEAITIGANKVAYIYTTGKAKTILLQSNCTRKVYKDMKKVYKRIANSRVSYA